MKTLVVFNLIGKDRKLLLPINTPIIFSWTGQDKVFNEMKTNDKFVDYIYQTCLTTSQYTYSKISYFTLTVESEKYEEKTIKVQDIFKLEDIKDNNKLILNYIYEIFEYILKFSCNKTFDNKNEPTIDIIFNIYREIKETLNNKLSDYSLRQYVVSELQTKYKLSQDNIAYTMKIYDSMI